VRLFFAAWPPAQTAVALHAWAAGLAGRAVARENIHLTLAFLGEADAAKAIGAAMRVRGARHELPIEEARFWKKNQIVWVGPREMPPLPRVAWPVDEFLLVRSRAATTGPIYEPVERFPLSE
jgi:2'-5' RNA ligase